MTKFLGKYLLFLVPILLLAYPMDQGLSALVKRKNAVFTGEYEVWNDIYSGTINADIVVYGSSRALRHFDPDILQDELGLSVYNCGMDGHQFWMEYYRHKMYIAHNNKPELIIQSLDSFTLQRPGFLYNYMQFLPYMFLNWSLYDHVKMLEGFTKPDFVIPLVRYFGETKALNSALSVLFNGSNNVKGRTKGYAPVQKEWGNDLDFAIEKSENIEIPVSTDTKKLFEHYIRECKDLGIKLIFVYSPEYIDGQKYISNRKQMLDYYYRISEQYKIPLLDFSENDICFDKQYFYNSLHMNKRGAELFSHELGKKLISLRNADF